nr:thioredoxin family protein [Alkalicoccus halolimnae]
MPGWQQLYDRKIGENFEILSVAVDGQGAGTVKPFLKETTFPTVIDENNQLVNLFQFKKIPNGIFIDEEGTIRLLKEGFDVADPADVKAVEQLISGEAETVNFDKSHNGSQETGLELQLAQTKYKLGMEYARQKRDTEALKELDDAVLLDPDNFTIRKQRWQIRFPEKFGSEIDFDWQQEQLQKEKKQEDLHRSQGLVCGPDGCFLPGS